jgi:thioredoxin-like negative regulator of GroEL
VIDALARAYAERVRVAKLNVDENPGVAARYALRDRLIGAQPRAVLEARLDAVLARTLR